MDNVLSLHDKYRQREWMKYRSGLYQKVHSSGCTLNPLWIISAGLSIKCRTMNSNI